MGGPQSYPQEVPVRAASEAVPEGGPSTQLPPPSGLPQGFTSRKLVTVSPASTYAGQRTGPQPSAGGAPIQDPDAEASGTSSRTGDAARQFWASSPPRMWWGGDQGGASERELRERQEREEERRGADVEERL